MRVGITIEDRGDMQNHVKVVFQPSIAVLLKMQKAGSTPAVEKAIIAAASLLKAGQLVGELKKRRILGPMDN